MFLGAKDILLPIFSNIAPSHDPGSEIEQGVLPEIVTEDETQEELPAKVILFNDEVHTFEEVIVQIMKATGCSLPRAEELTWEVHHTGKAMVFEGPVSKCFEVSSILEEIELMTQVEL